jgi:hypothetical protein
MTNGVATYSMANLSAGTDSVTATYSGDANFGASTSSVLSQVVQKANTTTAVSSAPTSANLNQIVTLTATVTPSTSGAPTGMVNFLDGSTQLGSSALNGSGVATFSISALAAGTHSVSAEYAGDGNYNLSTSTAMSLVVAAPGFGLSAAAMSPASVAPGASARSTITINPSGGLNPSSVALSCTVTPATSPAATCSLGTISVANNSGTSTLTVATSGPQAALEPPIGAGRSGLAIVLGVLMPLVFFSAAGVKKPAQTKVLSFCLLFVVLGGCLLQGACGGGSAPAAVGNSGTPAGAYQVTVTGTANGTPTQTTSVSLTVQ